MCVLWTACDCKATEAELQAVRQSNPGKRRKEMKIRKEKSYLGKAKTRKDK